MKTSCLVEIVAITACLIEGCASERLEIGSDHPSVNYMQVGYTGAGNYSGYNYQMPYSYKPEERMVSTNWYNPDFRR